MEIFNLLWNIFQVLSGYNLIIPVLLYTIWLFIKKSDTKLAPVASCHPDYAIIVTAYEQTSNLHAVVASILNLKYTWYLIYIVADKCDVSGLNFNDERVVLLRPPETLASNTKSHFYAIQRFERPHNCLTIIDSDNLVHPDYLNQLNILFSRNYQAVQGARHAKNLDTAYSCLDAARDIYYHFYDGKILFGLGSSATLSGSGMAFTTSLYRECLENLQITGAGFDKVLQAAIVERDYRIAYTEKAVVYDEKTSHSDQLVKQRSRWINTWFRYFKFGFTLTAKGVKNLSINQLLFGLTLLRPPLFLFILSSAFCMIADLWINPFYTLIWFFAFLLFIFGFGIALISSSPDKKIYRSLISIPGFMLLQILSLLKSRKANKYSVATQHYHNRNFNKSKEDE